MTAGGSLTGQRVLVTGPDGFVGRHLLDRLRRIGAQVVPVPRSVCDLGRPTEILRVVADVDPDVVMHLAAARQAASAQERAQTAAVNTLSGVGLIEGVSDRCRFVLRLGSSTEYGASDTPMDERTPGPPRGFFGATKAAGSMLFTATAARRGVRSAVLRAFQVYGPGDKPDRFVPTLQAAARSGRPVALTGPGRRRDWVWVHDVVTACLLAADRDDLPPGRVLNIGTGVQTSNEDVVRVAEQVWRRPIRTCPGAHPGREWDTGNWVSDPRAAARELGWQPQVDLATGLARCWRG